MSDTDAVDVVFKSGNHDDLIHEYDNNYEDVVIWYPEGDLEKVHGYRMLQHKYDSMLMDHPEIVDNIDRVFYYYDNEVVTATPPDLDKETPVGVVGVVDTNDGDIDYDSTKFVSIDSFGVAHYVAKASAETNEKDLNEWLEKFLENSFDVVVFSEDFQNWLDENADGISPREFVARFDDNSAVVKVWYPEKGIKNDTGYKMSPGSFSFMLMEKPSVEKYLKGVFSYLSNKTRDLEFSGPKKAYDSKEIGRVQFISGDIDRNKVKAAIYDPNNKEGIVVMNGVVEDNTVDDVKENEDNHDNVNPDKSMIGDAAVMVVFDSSIDEFIKNTNFAKSVELNTVDDLVKAYGSAAEKVKVWYPNLGIKGETAYDILAYQFDEMIMGHPGLSDHIKAVFLLEEGVLYLLDLESGNKEKIGVTKYTTKNLAGDPGQYKFYAYIGQGEDLVEIVK